MSGTIFAANNLSTSRMHLVFAREGSLEPAILPEWCENHAEHHSLLKQWWRRPYMNRLRKWCISQDLLERSRLHKLISKSAKMLFIYDSVRHSGLTLPIFLYIIIITIVFLAIYYILYKTSPMTYQCHLCICI